MEEIQTRDDCNNIIINKNECNCSSINCERHGFCCACVEYHRKNSGLPACLK